MEVILPTTVAREKIPRTAARSRLDERGCGHCGDVLKTHDDLINEICALCSSRSPVPAIHSNQVPVQAQNTTAAPFNAAEKALIRRTHGFMSGQRLLEVLNERQLGAGRPGVVPFTSRELYAEIGRVTNAPEDGAKGWSNLRKILANAARAGVLDLVTERVIEDFAVVFSLNSKQLVTLKDIVLQAKEDS